MQNTAIAKIHRILAMLWLAICSYLSVTLVQAIWYGSWYYSWVGQLGALCLDFLFVFLYLAGVVGSFFLLLHSSNWARILVSVVALLTVTGSVMRLFALFNSPPFSFIGIAFDIFALASAGVLLFARKYAVA